MKRSIIIALIATLLLVLTTAGPALAAGRDLTVTRPSEGNPNSPGAAGPPTGIVTVEEGHSGTSVTAPPSSLSRR